MESVYFAGKVEAEWSRRVGTLEFAPEKGVGEQRMVTEQNGWFCYV